MKLVRFLVVAFVAVLIVGCVPVDLGSSIIGSGRTTTKDFDLTGFTKVAAGSAFQVDISQGDAYNVTLTVDDNLLDRLDVKVSGDVLRIYLKPGIGIMGSMTMKAKITMPELTGLDLSGATHTSVSGFSTEKGCRIQLSGASTLSGDLTCGDTNMEVSGASKMNLDGAADTLKLNVSGASTASLDTFTSQDTTVDASGASHVTVNASDRLNARASGASSVTYVGQPAELTVNSSGASSINQK